MGPGMAWWFSLPFAPKGSSLYSVACGRVVSHVESRTYRLALDVPISIFFSPKGAISSAAWSMVCKRSIKAVEEVVRDFMPSSEPAGKSILMIN